MADKTVVVRLRALVDDFVKGMGAAAKSTDKVADSAKSLESVGGSVAKVGDTLTKNVSAPLAALGIASLKMSSDFNNTFTKMQALAGVSADEVEGLKESVLGLAGETGRGPRELADALYFLRSSGLSGKAAMDALEASAKASAAGLGDTAVVADAVSSAMNAYAKSGLEASEATDVLVATARAGKAEPAELAASLGQVLPIASELGVTFADVGGAIAALSLGGNDAARASTLLTNILAKMLKPSQQGAEALNAVGLSADDLGKMISERGLLGTLQTLKARLGDNGFELFMEDAQAVQGALALTGQNSKKVKEVFDEVRDSAGATDNAFSTWAENMGSKQEQAWAKLQVTLIQLGDTLAPIAATAADAISGLADAFGKLPDGVQQAAVYAGMFVAAIGPIMSIGGRAAQAVSTLTDAVHKYKGAASGLATGAGLVAGLAAVAYGAVQAGDALQNAFMPLNESNINKLENSLLKFGETGRTSGELAALAGTDFNRLGDAMQRVAEPGVGTRIRDVATAITSLGGDNRDLEQARKAIDDVDKALVQLSQRDPEAAAASFKALTREMRDQGVSTGQVKSLLNDYMAQVASIDTQKAVEQTGGFSLSMEGAAGATARATQALAEYGDKVRASVEPLFGLFDALAANVEANNAVKEAQNALNAAIAQHGPKSLQAAAAQIALTGAQRQAAGSAMDVTGATAALNAKIAEQPGFVGAAKAQLATWAAQGLISKGTAQQLGVQFDNTAAKARNLGAVDPNVAITATDQASPKIEDVGRRIRALSGLSATVRLNALITGDAARMVFGGGRAAGGPVRSDRLYEVGEGGRAELLDMGGRQYLIPGSSGRVIPAGSGPAAAAVPAGRSGVGSITVVGSGNAGAFVAGLIRRGDLQLRVDGDRVRVAA